MKNLFFESKKPIIGVIYLPPLPGYEKCPGMNEIVDFVMDQVNILESCGIDGALLENENDHPYKILAPPEIISAMTVVTSKVTSKFNKIKIGVEFLLNDPKASLAIAHAAGANFIRTDYFVDRMAREEYGGEMQIDPAGVINYRENIGATNIKIFSDIQVKYAQMLEPDKPLAQSAKEAIHYQSSGVVVSSNMTGVAPDTTEIKNLKNSIGAFPIIIGSGLNINNAKELLKFADGAMVGSSLMESGIIKKEKVLNLTKVLKDII